MRKGEYYSRFLTEDELTRHKVKFQHSLHNIGIEFLKIIINANITDSPTNWRIMKNY